MPRRRRTDKRRVEHDKLDLLIVLANTNTRGCRAIPDDVTLDDLYETWTALGDERRSSWAHRAFVQGLPRPCEGMLIPDDPFDLARGRKLKCRETVCRFAHEPQP